jgi:hypothetical protein
MGAYGWWKQIIGPRPAPSNLNNLNRLCKPTPPRHWNC